MVPWSGLLNHDQIHTIGVGAARPSDFDAHMASIARIDETAELIPPIEARLLGMLEEAHGKEWVEQWSVGLPDHWGMVDGEGAERELDNNPELVNYNAIIWLWTLAKAWDMVSFGRYRYGGLAGNRKNWDKGLEEGKDFDERYAVQLVSPNPGLELSGVDIDSLLPRLHRSPFPERVLAALKEAHEMFAAGSTVPLPPFAYDMQPDKPWPERQGQVDFSEAERLAKLKKEQEAAAAAAEGKVLRRWRRSPFPGAYYSGVPTQLHKRMPCKDGTTVDGLRIRRRPGSAGATGELRDTWNSSQFGQLSLSDLGGEPKAS